MSGEDGKEGKGKVRDRGIIITGYTPRGGETTEILEGKEMDTAEGR